ncbi:PAS domain S-box protein [Haloferula chungangensis]|uniref:histidine kinase n=1 Tax=Haloferula chungangensis TaxID=1048331 RepID=A0ABW2L502_9BACT
MSDSPNIETRWQRRLARERTARSEAERLLEAKSGELYEVNQELEKLLSTQGEILEGYRRAVFRLTNVLLSLGEDHEANVHRLLNEAGRLLDARGGLVVRMKSGEVQPRWSMGWRDSQEISETIWRRGLESRQIEEWRDNETTYVFIPLEIRMRRVGVIVIILGPDKKLDELSKMVAEFLGSGVGGEVERREAKSEMKVTEQRYESLFHASMDSILIIDFEGRIREASDSVVKTFGLSREALLRGKLSDLVSSDHREQATNAFDQIKGVGRCHYETELRRSDGSTFPAEVVGSSFQIGGESRVYAIFRDISQRKKSQAAIIERERKFRTVFEQSLDGIVLHDLEGRILDVNETLCKLLGWSRQEMTAKSLADLHPERALTGCRLAMEEVAERGRHRYECEFSRSDGTDFTAEVWANAFELGGERVVQGIVRDVTEQRDKENEIREAMEAAELANESKSVFLATMSHEIRTPLNGILGFTNLLESSEMSSDQRNSVEMIRKSGDVLLGLINNILDFSRAESGRIVLKNEPFDPGLFVRNTVALHQGVADGKKLKLQVHVAEDVPSMIMGAKTELRQVMMNLVGNAVKFTDEGTVTISLEKLRSKKLKFSVRDSGIGFPEQDGERLFEAFFQVDLSSTRRHGGTGLGLAICRRLVEAMGGEIRAANLPDRGAEFVVEIPLRQVATQGVSSQPEGHRSAALLNGGGTKVLVVEDHPVNARLLKLMLEKLNFAVEVASNGREGLEALKMADDISIVLMDMRMPEMDGLEATQRLRAGEAGEAVRTLPVVAVTANAMEADQEACREAGMDYYLSKPINGRELEKVMLDVMAPFQASGI